MKKRNRMLALLLAGSLAAASLLAACSGDGAGTTDTSSTQETAADKEAEEGSAGDDAEAGDADDAEAADTPDTNEADSGAASDSAAAEDTYKGKPVDFTFMTLGSVDSIFYDDFAENPSARYWLSKEWDSTGDGEMVSIDVSWDMLPEEGASDYVNTLMATGEYPDVLPLSYVSDSLYNLYTEGVILDLTDLIPQYMPNLWTWLNSDPSFLPQMTVEVDGEQKLLYLPDAHDAAEDAWGCYNYRRDWIVKYGKNPDTGEAFTGEYDADGIWHDDVVFPSGDTDPYYISDWEWMLDIFQTAIEDLGIEDGYAFQNTTSGYVGTGDLSSGFNVHIGYSGYYFDQNGEVKYGWTEDNTRAFIECMTTWYANGWMNQDFEENGDALFFQIDTPRVYAGKVGAWYGLISQWGKGLDTGASEYTDGICVYAAPQPINDLYGDDINLNYTPDMFYKNSVLGRGEAITSKAKDKDLGTLLTAIDWLYSTEGGLLRYMGLSDEIMAELDAEGSDITALYHEYDIDYAYQVSEDENGEPLYIRNNAILDYGDNLKVALNLVRTIGMTTLTHVDFGYDENYAHNMEMANMYSNGAYLGLLTDKMDADLADEKSLLDTNANTYIAQAVPDFITGRTDISSDDEWQEFIDTVAAFGGEAVAEELNVLAGN